MIISFKNLIKISWQTVWKHKLLWIFGLFIGGGGVFVNYKFIDKGLIVNFFNSGGVVFSSLWAFFVIIFVVLFGLFLLSLIARASLLQSVKLVRDKKSLIFKENLKFGLSYLKKFFVFELIFILLNFVFILLISLVVFLQMKGVLNVNIVDVLVVGLGVVMLLFNLLIVLFKHYSYCFLVFENNSVIQSIKSGFSLMKNNLKVSLLAYLIYLGLTLGFALSVLLVSLILLVPLFLFGLFFSLLASSMVMPVIIIVTIVLILLVRILLQGMFKVFAYRYLTEVYFFLKGLEGVKKG